jgi:hypothetical protein
MTRGVRGSYRRQYHHLEENDMKRTTRSTAAALIASLGLMVPTAAFADAPEQSGVVERAPQVSAWLIQGDGLVVVTGPPIAEGCLSFPDFPPLPEYTATIVDTPTGATVTTIVHTQYMEVYSDQGATDVFEWYFGLMCPSVLAGDPIPPLATGEGHVKVRSRTDADGVQHGTVAVTATLTTPDDEPVHLNTHGRFGESVDFVNFGG